jgi:hypothetical protein
MLHEQKLLVMSVFFGVCLWPFRGGENLLSHFTNDNREHTIYILSIND